ncbi:T9SS type A sorting domain-containing protein [Hymenobacter arizonensis]|uniref:Por secretion system C-terminal sorting domain-containing protein n=1 Tax=Hymenobacter arizonensis TaxID=1227077 RepID=A0A1I5Z520_HYMAR|nr:T9SS type A sorting domain-containing protein [Hymenobacter arizonensis]SFQ51574.1 Por secretion system C-terminal sorting domain-containing protein [Hymenobacter arizonensis]
MKLFLTLGAMGLLTAASFTAQAQFTVDGQATAAEIGTGQGKYQLAGTYSGNHLDADRGLQALYVGYTATTLNLMVVASGESATANAYRGIVLYINTPARGGRPAGMALGGSDVMSPLRHKPVLDMETDYGFRVLLGPGPNEAFFSRVSYATGPGTASVANDTYFDASDKLGTAITAPASVTDLAGTKVAYRSSANITANTDNRGFEIEIPLSMLGTTGTPIATGSRLDLMAAFIEGNGVFLSDLIPGITGRTAAYGADPDFTAIAGNQHVSFVLGTGVLLANRAAVAAGLDFQVYPNPARATSKVAYKVPAGQQPVSLAVYNTMGQRVRSLASAPQAGNQEFALGSLPAGTYLVKLQIGDQVTSKMVVME